MESKYKNPVCRGSVLLRNACGSCERCVEQKAAIAAQIKSFDDNPPKPDPPSKEATLKTENADLRERLSVSEAREKQLRDVMGQVYRQATLALYEPSGTGELVGICDLIENAEPLLASPTSPAEPGTAPVPAGHWTTHNFIAKLQAMSDEERARVLGRFNALTPEEIAAARSELNSKAVAAMPDYVKGSRVNRREPRTASAEAGT